MPSSIPFNKQGSDNLTLSSLPLKNKYDIGFYFDLSKTLSDSEKYDLIKNCFVPSDTFEFEKSSKRNHFKHAWLKEFKWLRYSKAFNGGYCLPCSLFAHQSPKFKNQTILISKGVSDTKSAKTMFKRHENGNGIHERCVQHMNAFVSIYKGKTLSINNVLDNVRLEQFNYAKSVLPPIIDTVILCGHLGIPLRGHRDDKKNYPEAGEYSLSPGLGNFVELLNFGIRRGDTKLKEHYTNHPSNASYFSKTSQNDFINICGAIILEKIILSIKPSSDSSYFFSVIADEAMDSSQKEQLALVLRYIDSSNDVQEEFVGFVHLKDGLSGKAIADSIVKKVTDLGLDMMNCRGQGYDGAGAVSGHKNGASAHLLRICRKKIIFIVFHIDYVWPFQKISMLFLSATC